MIGNINETAQTLQQLNIKVASFKDIPIEERLKFPKSKCILPISLNLYNNKKDFFSSSFYSTIKLVSKKFEYITILIGDSLYRHTLKFNYPNKTDLELKKIAIDAGDAWLEQNSLAFQQLDPYKYCIIRWENVINHQEFNNKYELVLNLYNSDPEYKEAIDSTAREYLNRVYNRKEEEIKLLNGEQQVEEIERLRNKNYEFNFNSCIEYLIEECTGMCLHSTSPFARNEYEVYPTKRTPALAMTYDKLIKPNDPDILKSVCLRFKKKEIKE